MAPGELVDHIEATHHAYLHDELPRIEALLRQPFRGAPSSLLKGDEHFLPQLNAALTSLAVPTDTVPPKDAPIDLTMMTTVLHGNQEVTVDALGQRLPQSVHGARFHWKRPVDAEPAQHAADRPAVVVLDEGDIVPDRSLESLQVEALEEEAALVAEHPGLQDQHAVQRSGGHLHQNTWLLTMRIRYWP